MRKSFLVETLEDQAFDQGITDGKKDATQYPHLKGFPAWPMDARRCCQAPWLSGWINGYIEKGGTLSKTGRKHPSWKSVYGLPDPDEKSKIWRKKMEKINEVFGLGRRKWVSKTNLISTPKGYRKKHTELSKKHFRDYLHYMETDPDFSKISKTAAEAHARAAQAIRKTKNIDWFHSLGAFKLTREIDKANKIQLPESRKRRRKKKSVIRATQMALEL